MKTPLLLLLPVLLAACDPFASPDPSRPPRVEADAMYFRHALAEYAAEYGAYPLGDTDAIVQALKGANPRHIEYIEGFPPDPWDTPYRIDYPSPNLIRVISAGPDRKFNTSDDFISMRPPPPPNPSR